jgi:hypothetical protein
MAAAAGFPARVVRVAARDDKLFELTLFDLYSQFDTELAVVQVGGADRIYDPATPYCPPGLIPWKCTAASVLDPAREPPSVAHPPSKTPAGSPEQALIRREAVLQMDAEGRLTGTVKVRFGGQEGLRLRLDYLADGPETAKNDLETELSELLPAGAKAALQSIENLRSGADDVVAAFDVTLPPLTTSAGDRTLLKVAPIFGVEPDALRHAQRKHPLSFPYPYRRSDDIVNNLPEGMAIEAVPEPRSETGEWFEHSLSLAVENRTTLRVRREIALKRCDYPAATYSTVRAFFDRVRAADEEQVMLVGGKEQRPGQAT